MRDQFDMRRRILRRLSAAWMTAALVGGTLAGVVAAPAPVSSCCRPSDAQGGRRHARPEHSRRTHQLLQVDDQRGQHRHDRRRGTRSPVAPAPPWMDAAHTTPNPDYPGSCNWSSIAGPRELRAGGRPGRPRPTSTPGHRHHPARRPVPHLRPRRRLQARRHAVHGPGGVGLVVVPLQPLPLPTATIKAQVFADVTEANGQYDPGEDGLSGFAGKITDYLGQVNTDVFGNPLCTTYAVQRPEQRRRPGPGREIILDADHEPTVDPPRRQVPVRRHQHGRRRQQRPTTACTSAKGLDPTLARGELTIPNLGPNRYALSLVPPTGSSWVQTTTLEGNHDWDAWAMEGATGYDTEFVVAGEPFPADDLRLRARARATRRTGTTADSPASTAGGARARSRASSTPMDIYIPQKGGAEPADARASRARRSTTRSTSRGSRCPTSTAATPPSTSAAATPTARSQITNVPDGTYTLTYWDEPQDYILDLLSVTVAERRDRRHGRPAAGRLVHQVRRLRLQRPQPQRQARRRRARRPELRPDPARAREHADGPRLDGGHHRPVRPLRDGAGLSADRVARPRGLRRPLLHDRRHLPGRQPARRRPRSSARASTSACCRSSACPARSTGASTPTTRPARTASTRRTAASSARSATTPPATSSTRSTRPPRTGSRASPGITVELYAPVACGTNAGTAVRRARRLRARPRRLLCPRDKLAQHLRLRDLGAADRLRRPRRRRQPARQPGRPAGPARRSAAGKGASKAR